MAISNNYIPVKQLGNGVTAAYGASWPIFAAAYIRVYLENVITGVQVLQVQGTNYTVLFDDTGFVVTFLPGFIPTNANYVVIGRSIELDQTNPYKTSKGFDGTKIEGSYDKLTGMVQDLSNQVGRSLKFPLGSSAIGSLPNPVDLAVLVWDGVSGALKNGPLTTDISNAAANAAIAVAAAATATAGAATVTAALASAADYKATMTGTANAQILTTGLSVALTVGMQIRYIPTLGNTTTNPTATIDANAAVTIYKAGPSGLVALSPGDYVPGVEADLYLVDSTHLQLLNPQFPAVLPPSAQCRFVYVSTTSVALQPFNGNKISFPDGRVYAIPAAGITSSPTSAYLNGTAAQALTASTLYYAYLWNQGTVAAPNFVIDFSTTGHSVDSASGIRIKTGDATRVLIGMVYPAAGPLFAFTDGSLFVASWYNRRMVQSRTTKTTDTSVNSGTFVEVDTTYRNRFLNWSDAQAQYWVAGGVTIGGLASTPVTGVAFDGTTLEPGLAACTNQATFNTAISLMGYKTLTEGLHYSTIMGYSSNTNLNSYNGTASTAPTINGIAAMV